MATIQAERCAQWRRLNVRKWHAQGMFLTQMARRLGSMRKSVKRWPQATPKSGPLKWRMRPESIDGNNRLHRNLLLRAFVSDPRPTANSFRPSGGLLHWLKKNLLSDERDMFASVRNDFRLNVSPLRKLKL